jgi:methylmalonyl-CoA mutase
MSAAIEAYKSVHKVRFVTATSLFDGHDATINVIRRILQSSGAEVIHLGHNRSADEIVTAAIQEDAQGIAVSCYQGGHVAFFKYIRDLLETRGAGHIRVFGGGGGVIVPDEIREIEGCGVCKIFSPEDGRRMGLQGMINHMLELCDFAIGRDLEEEIGRLQERDIRAVNTLISLAEQAVHEHSHGYGAVRERIRALGHQVPVLGITGTGGAGKSSLTDELVRRFVLDFPGKSVAILAVDPSRQRTGGALLGDRIRMNSINTERVYMRSLATRDSHSELSDAFRTPSMWSAPQVST